MSSVFQNFPTPLPSHHARHIQTVPRLLTMPSPAQVHNFPVLPNQHTSTQAPQSTQTTTLTQAPPDPKKRHACPTCGRAFTTSGHLARHIRVHTGERNHKCPFPGCETRCSRQDNLQQHYRIHLSPGSRRSSSTRARTETKKKTSLSTSTTLPSLSPPVSRSALHDEPPDSPPPLARATVLPPLPRGSYPVMSHERSEQTQGRSHSSASASGSGSSAGSPHSYASATASPDISPSIPQTTSVNGGGYGNILGLSHERQHSPEYPYNSYTQTSSGGHVYPQRSLNMENYGMSSNSSSQYSSGASAHSAAPSSFAHTLPPIQSLDGTNNNSSFGYGRVSQQQQQQQQQHPGPYPSYETSSYASNGHNTSNWSTPENSYHHHHPSHHNTWWSQNGVSVGVSVGAGTQRGYQSYGTS